MVKCESCGNEILHTQFVKSGRSYCQVCYNAIMKQEDLEENKTALKNYGFILRSKFSGVHWILTDLEYGFISDKERAIKELTKTKEAIEKTLAILEI